MPAARRIGLFGGTFDPPHHAHLALAQAAVQALALDELRWVPVGQPWQKQRRITAAGHREAMLREALAGQALYRLERCELERAGPSYMLDTVLALQAEPGAAPPAAQWYLLIGQDQYAGLHTWHRWRELLQRVTPAVACRPGAPLRADPEVQRWPHIELPMAPHDISSTDIRQRVSRGEPIGHLVPAAVARYIALHQLYRQDAAAH